jgi:hypothetical protein
MQEKRRPDVEWSEAAQHRDRTVGPRWNMPICALILELTPEISRSWHWHFANQKIRRSDQPLEAVPATGSFSR